MLAWLSTLALALPLVSALTVNTPTNWQNGQTVTVTWTGTTMDPSSFSILLVNIQFHNTFAVANSVLTINGETTFTLPEVPNIAGYTLELIANNDVNTVYATSGSFAIGAASSSSATDSSATSTPSTTDSSLSLTPTGTISTPSATGTNPVSSVSKATTGTASGASSSPSSLNNSGAASFKLAGVAPAAALVLSAVAGAVMVF